jgi:hypothetical protein
MVVILIKDVPSSSGVEFVGRIITRRRVGVIVQWHAFSSGKLYEEGYFLLTTIGNRVNKFSSHRQFPRAYIASYSVVSALLFPPAQVQSR